MTSKTVNAVTCMFTEIVPLTCVRMECLHSLAGTGRKGVQIMVRLRRQKCHLTCVRRCACTPRARSARPRGWVRAVCTHLKGVHTPHTSLARTP
jgi:hypothetical protein